MKCTLCFLLSLLISFSALGQLREENRPMSAGNQNAIVLTIPAADGKFVDKLWKKYITDKGGKSIRNRKAKEWTTEEFSVPGAGSNITLYASSREIGQDVEQIVWFDLGDSYLSSHLHGNGYLQGEKFVMEFGLMVTREMIRLELEEEEKKLRDLENRMTRLKRQNDGFHREIKIAEERIETAKKNIVDNEREQESTTNALEDQRLILESVKERLKEF